MMISKGNHRRVIVFELVAAKTTPDSLKRASDARYERERRAHASASPLSFFSAPSFM
jgi:hypothetical protein